MAVELVLGPANALGATASVAATTAATTSSLSLRTGGS
jgi:hypothetical protein